MSQPHETNPPHWPLRWLRFFVKEDYLEEIEGDMEELFHDYIEQYSYRQARRMYAGEVLRLLRPVLLKNLNNIPQLNHYPMFKNYFKVSIRSLMKNPLSSFINIVGLAVAIGICLVVYASLAFDYSIDRFHENKDNVYLLTYFGDRDGSLQQYGQTPRPLGEMLREDFTHIENVCRIEDRPVVMKYEDNVFHEQVRYVEPEFLQMFTFPLKWGLPGTLADMNSIILSRDMAVKYFGEENPVGRDMLVKFDAQRSKTFTVSGVAQAFPEAHIIDFDFLINFQNLPVADPSYDLNDWRASVNATFIQVDDPADLPQIKAGLDKYRALQNKAQDDWVVKEFALERLADLHLNSGDIREGISYDNSAEARFALPIIALFMLALACFNYINIAIVSAAKRLKEIGVRKVIGAHRRRIVLQFLAENIVVTLFALILGLGLAITLILPWFSDISRDQLDISLIDGRLWIFLVLLLLLTGIISGMYPALYISKFEAVKIFKGSVQFGKKNPLTKVLLGLQLVLACILMTGAIMYTQNTAYLATRSWGYDQHQTIYASVPDQAAFDQMNAALRQIPSVVSVAGSSHHLGKDIASTIVRHQNQPYEVQQLAVDANYFETMGLTLRAGRGFVPHAESDQKSVIVNETVVRNMGLNQPLGQLLEIDSTKYEVVGVIKDFHTYSFYEEVHPTIFTVAKEAAYRYVALRAQQGAEKEAYAALHAQWNRLFPETPFQGGYQSDVWGTFYTDLDTQVRFSRAVALVAVLLASLGFYGLVTLNVSGRIREFSIRKILGAELKNIASYISQQYVILTAVALLIGAPLSYVLIKAQIGMLYPESMPLGIFGVALAVLMLVLVLGLVVFLQVRRVSSANLLHGLKVE